MRYCCICEHTATCACGTALLCSANRTHSLATHQHGIQHHPTAPDVSFLGGVPVTLQDLRGHVGQRALSHHTNTPINTKSGMCCIAFMPTAAAVLWWQDVPCLGNIHGPDRVTLTTLLQASEVAPVRA